MWELLSWGETGWGDDIAQGALVTIAVGLAAYSFGVMLGLVGAFMKLSPRWIWRGPANFYTTIVRGVPELLVIYLLFFGGNSAIMAVAGAFGYVEYIELNNFTIGTLAVGCICAAYAAEVWRGAVLSIPKGQLEAAKSLGMSRFLLFRRILLPQLLRYALPGLGNVWQLTIKDTALVSVTGLAELMRISSLARNSTREPFLFYIIAALVFLLITSLSSQVFSRAEKWANRGVRQANRF
jgi:octopine/nopaline transport system permease protein